MPLDAPPHVPAPDATRPDARYPKRALAAFLFTLIVGPLIGCLPFAIAMGTAQWRNWAPRPDAPPVETFASFSESMIAAGYMMGGLPAFLAAVPIAVIVWRHGVIGYLLVVLLAALGCAVAAAIAIPLLRITPLTALAIAAFLIGPAILAALSGRWLAACILLRLK